MEFSDTHPDGMSEQGGLERQWLRACTPMAVEIDVMGDDHGCLIAP